MSSVTTAALAIAQPDAREIRRGSEELRRIYEAAFQPIERDSFESIFLTTPPPLLRLAYSANRPIAFAELLPLEGATLLLRYLAVDAPFRAQGVGRALLESITWEFSETASRIIFETEEPSSAPDPGAAVRRIRFYERWDAHELRCLDRYFYPSRQDITDRQPALLLERHLGAGDCLRDDALRTILRSLYARYYGQAASDLHLSLLLSRVIC